MITSFKSHPFHHLNDPSTIELANQFKIDLPILYKNIGDKLSGSITIFPNDEDMVELNLVVKR